MKKNKCKDCVWAAKINKELVFCLFPKCVRKKDKNDKATGNI